MFTTSKLIILIGVILTSLNSSRTCYPSQKSVHDIENLDSIITIDVGGQIFKSHIKTLTKFPESMLASMFNRQDHGISRGSPSEEKCAICKSQVLLSRSYVGNLMIFQPLWLQHTQKSIKLHYFLMMMSESTCIPNLDLRICKKK